MIDMRFIFKITSFVWLIVTFVQIRTIFTIPESPQHFKILDPHIPPLTLSNFDLLSEI